MRKSKYLFFILTIPAIIILISAVLISSDMIKAARSDSVKEAVATNVTNPTDETAASESDDTTLPAFSGQNPDSETTSDSKPEPEPETEPVFEEYDIHLLMIGDNLFHYGVINAGIQADGTRNYDFEFDGIREFLNLADIKIINQETPFGGNDKPFIAYPKFNTPEEVGDSIARAGFNVMLAATNHAGDMGEEGLINFYNYMHDNFSEVLVTGIHGEDISGRLPNTVTGGEGVKILTNVEGSDLDRSELTGPDSIGSPSEDFSSRNRTQESDQPCVSVDPSKDYSRINLLNIKGKIFAFLNYTYGNNYETYFKWQEGRLDFLCSWDPDTRRINMREINPQVLEDIRLARTIADVVIVCPHWGIEYRTTPTVYQTAWAKEMTKAGADVIIGAHPHVPEPVEWVSSDDGKEALCYYSLGNYASTQNLNVDVLLEGMAWVSFHVTENGISVTKEDCGIVPLVNHYTSGPLRYKRTYLLEDYTQALASEHGVTRHTADGGGGFKLDLENLWEHAGAIFKNNILTRKQILDQYEPE